MPAGTVPPGSAVTPLARGAGTGWWGPPPGSAVTPVARCAGTGWWGPPPVRRLGTVPRPLVLVPALAGVLLLAGCAGPPPVDEQALADWRSAQETATEADPDVLAVLTGDIGPGQQDPADVGPGVSVQFPASHDVDHLEFSCYGNGQMQGIARIQSGTASGSLRLEPVDCRDSPHTIRLTDLASRKVDSVGFNAFDSDRSSAWRLVIVGTTSPDG